MNYKKLGSTDVDVSTICLGTMTWGEQNTKADGFEQMDYAIDNGVTKFWAFFVRIVLTFDPFFFKIRITSKLL